VLIVDVRGCDLGSGNIFDAWNPPVPSTS